MKHSRAEVVNSTVFSYLKRRHYTDSEFFKSDNQFCQTKEQLAVVSTVNKEVTNKNSVSFSSIVFDSDVIDQHFSRLKYWVSQLSGSIHEELSTFLPPLLCHLTIDLLRWNVVLESSQLTLTNAINFLRKHAPSIINQDIVSGNGNDVYGNLIESEYIIGNTKILWNLLEELHNLQDCCDISKSKSLLLFRSCKYRLSLSPEAHVLLQQYLSDHGHICLIQVIGTWFDVIEVPETDHGSEEEDSYDEEEDEIMVKLWEDDSREDTTEEVHATYDISVTMNGCKEDCSPLGSGTQEEFSPDESTMMQESNDYYASVSMQNDFQGYIEEEEQVKLLSESIYTVREGQSPICPLLLYSLENIENNVVCTTVSHSGELLAAGFETSDVKVWGLTEGGIPAELREVFLGANIAHFKHKKQNARLACDVNTTEGLLNIMEEEEDEWTDSPMILRGHCGSVQDVAISGQLLYSCSTDTTLRSWNLQDQMCAAVYRGHSYPIWCVDVSAWGVYIATGSQDKTARLWTPDRAFPLRTYAGHGMDVDCIRFHPNGLYLATGSCDHSVRLWSVSDGKLVRVFPHPSSNKSGSRGLSSTATLPPSITNLAFSPDGKYLASGAEDQKVRIWDLAAGSMVNELTVSTTTVLAESQQFIKEETPSSDVTGVVPASGPISGLCWSSGGERLSCAFQSGSVAVWEVMTGGPNGEYFPAFTSVSSASLPHSFEEELRANSERSQPLGLNTYSTEMQTISSINYIDRDVLVCVGISPSKSLSSS